MVIERNLLEREGIFSGERGSAEQREKANTLEAKMAKYVPNRV